MDLIHKLSIFCIYVQNFYNYFTVITTSHNKFKEQEFNEIKGCIQIVTERVIDFTPGVIKRKINRENASIISDDRKIYWV